MLTVEGYHKVLDEAVVEWQSKEFLDAAMKRLCKRSDPKVKDAHALVQTLTREMNDKFASKMGFPGDSDTKRDLMGAWYVRVRQTDPTLDLKMHGVQLTIAKFTMTFVEALKQHKQAEWAALYPSIGLEEYRAGPDFWHINDEFPGLQAVHKDPWIFVCKNVLSPKVCQQLIAKSQSSLVPSWVNRGDRTSWEVRICPEEVPGIQDRISKLLRMPISHFESLKVSRYTKGEYFGSHLDAIPKSGPEGCPTCGASQPFSNRVVTCIVYLTDCKHGGATKFDCGVKVRPLQGMACVHFPAYMDTATEPEDRGRQDERTVHASREAQDEKFICQQWGWTGPLDREAEIRCNGARSCSDDVL
mmetsp:Transcript_16821/g.37973  ORF Transcript_16821/g.37973 Transcript_16821/m.37973 type:complete len:358 (+) Transcript_16821:70-1143(+)